MNFIYTTTLILFLFSSPLLTSSSRPCIILYHLSKAGGGSLHVWAHKNNIRLWTYYGKYSGAGVLNYLSDRNGRIKIDQADIIMGHFRPNCTGPTLVDALAARNRTCLEWTILRDTASRVMSLLHYLYPHVKNHTKCLVEDMTKPSKHCVFHHPNGLMLLHNNICTQFTSTNVVWNQIAGRAYEPWKCDIEDAKRTLANLDGVAFLEDDLNPVLLSWMKHLNRNTSTYFPMPHAHITTHYVNDSYALIDLIEEYNTIDTEIVAWAKNNTRRIGNVSDL